MIEILFNFIGIKKLRGGTPPSIVISLLKYDLYSFKAGIDSLFFNDLKFCFIYPNFQSKKLEDIYSFSKRDGILDKYLKENYSKT